MELRILPANPKVRELNEIDPTRVMVGHGIGFSAIFKKTRSQISKAQIPLFQDLESLLPGEKETVVQIEGWVTEILSGNKFKVSMAHLKLEMPFLVVDGSEIETHSSFRRSLRRHIASG